MFWEKCIGRVIGIDGRKMYPEIIPVICCFVLNNGLAQRRPKTFTLQRPKMQKFSA